MKAHGFIFFVVFSEKESSYGIGTKIEPFTYESKPGRPVHYFNEKDLTGHFERFNVIDTGIIEEYENHGEIGPHTHKLRFLFAQKSP